MIYLSGDGSPGCPGKVAIKCVHVCVCVQSELDDDSNDEDHDTRKEVEKETGGWSA